LAPIGGAGQARLAAGSILLHGDAPLLATYVAAAGVGRLLVTGEPPELAGRDPMFALERGEPAAEADVVVDFGDGAAFEAATGPAVALGEPGEWTREVAEMAGAAEALKAILGMPLADYGGLLRVRLS
jgi:hypothetical protein